MSDRKLALCLAFLIPILVAAFLPYSVIDLSVWIAHGKSFLQTGTILRHDSFSVLPTRELVYPSFGISVVYAALYGSVGLLGVCWFHLFVILPAVLALVYRPLIEKEILPGSRLTLIILFTFFLGAAPMFAERPALIALLPLAVSFTIVSRIREQITWRDFAFLFALEFIWVNVHGSFVLLPMMLGWKLIFNLREIKNVLREFLLFAGVAFASVLNPFGLRVYPYLLETAHYSKERGITEWGFPTLIAQFPTGLLFWILFFSSIYILVKAHRSQTLFKTLSHPFFMLVLLGTFSIRSAALVFVVLIPWADDMGLLTRKVIAHPDRRSRQNLLVFFILFALLPLALMFKPRAWDETAIFTLAQKIKDDGRKCSIFNAWELGSFLMLELPNHTYLDSRNIIYSKSYFQAYEDALAGKANWKSFLKQGEACFVIVEETQARGLIQKLQNDPEWQFQGKEGAYTLYSKKP